MARVSRRTLVGERHLHVTAKAVDGALLFPGGTQRDVLLDRWSERLPAAGVRVAAFALLPNHVHAVVEVDDVALLGDALRAAFSDHARAVNRRLGRSGDLFRDRYHARPFRDDAHLESAIRYVERNPLGPDGVAGLLRRRETSLGWVVGARPEPPPCLDVALARALVGGAERYLAVVADPDDHAILRARVEAVGVEAVLAAGWPQRAVAAALGIPRTTLASRVRHA